MQDSPTKVMEDNAACIYSSMDAELMNSRSKHINTRIFKPKEFVKDQIMVLAKIASEAQAADNLSKPLPLVGIELDCDIMSTLGIMSCFVICTLIRVGVCPLVM